MARSFRHRLSQIDKIRDKALENGNLDLLDVADRLELDARRKFAEMTARMDQRQLAGRPGVGPLVRLPVDANGQQPMPPGIVPNPTDVPPPVPQDAAGLPTPIDPEPSLSDQQP